MRADPKFMVDLYDSSIDQWLEDTPLTYHQEMQLKHGGETLEKMLRLDIERLSYWKCKLEEKNNDSLEG